jgi:hypothetical protein
VDLEIVGIRARAHAKNLVRLLGLLAVLLGFYHLFVPFVGPSLPTWAPWRVFGLTANVASGAIYHIGDVVVIAVGAIVAWFV